MKDQTYISAIKSIAKDEVDPKDRTRHCVNCRTPFLFKDGYNSNYCSYDCFYELSLAKNRSPYNENKELYEGDWRDGNLKRNGMPTAGIDANILKTAESREENRMIVEDMREINQIVFEELNRKGKPRQVVAKYQKQKNQAVAEGKVPENAGYRYRVDYDPFFDQKRGILRNNRNLPNENK
jgi:hypothetical protein